MRAVLRKWPKRQGRMILQAMYGDEPREARRIVPPNVQVGWNTTSASEPVYADSENAAPASASAARVPASYA